MGNSVVQTTFFFVHFYCLKKTGQSLGIKLVFLSLYILMQLYLFMCIMIGPLVYYGPLKYQLDFENSSQSVRNYLFIPVYQAWTQFTEKIWSCATTIHTGVVLIKLGATFHTTQSIPEVNKRYHHNMS